MKATVLSVTGWEEAFTAMFMSKRTWTTELGSEILNVVEKSTDRYGRTEYPNGCERPGYAGDCDKKFKDWSEKLFKWGPSHITLLRYLDIVIMTEGMHRAGQDDIDAHAKRFDNRIIRNSTRLATYAEQEVSEFYQDKIKTDGEIAKILGLDLPQTVDIDGTTWVKSTNGYVKEEYAENKDVKRGLYMLSIPSNFISKINLCEWAHVFRERNKDGHANPEVKIWAESVTDQLKAFHPAITRDFVLSIKN